MTKSTEDYAILEPFVRAFAAEFTAIWGGTQFQEEIDGLAYLRAMTCWLNSTYYDLESRREYMYRYLEGNFSSKKTDDTINELYRLIPVEQGATRILRNLCILYNREPKRKIKTAAKEYEALYTQAVVNSALRKAHELAKFTNNALIMPVVQNGKLEIDVFPADLYRVKSSEKNFRQIVELWIPITTRGVTDFHVWSAEEYRRVDYKGTIIKQEPNRYGRIPGVFLQFDRSTTDYYGSGLFEIVFAILDSNKLKFLADNNVDYNGFSVWLAINFGAQADLRLSPNRVLRADNVTSGEAMPIEPDLRPVSPDEKYLGIEELRDVRYRRALRELGLPASLYDSNPGLVASGVAMLLERQELLEIRAKDIEVMRKCEQELCDCIRDVVNADLGLNLPATEVGVDYSEFEIVLEPAADFDLKTKKFEYGVMGARDYVTSISGNDLVTDDKSAIEFIKKNRELFKTLSESADGQPSGGISQQSNADNTGQQGIEKPTPTIGGSAGENIQGGGKGNGSGDTVGGSSG